MKGKALQRNPLPFAKLLYSLQDLSSVASQASSAGTLKEDKLMVELC